MLALSALPFSRRAVSRCGVGVRFAGVLGFFLGPGTPKHARYDAARAAPGCQENIPFNENYCNYNNAAGCVPINGCGAGSLAIIYFYSFTLLLSFVFVNLFIAVILEGFGQCQKMEKEAALRREIESEHEQERRSMEQMALVSAALDQALHTTSWDSQHTAF